MAGVTRYPAYFEIEALPLKHGFRVDQGGGNGVPESVELIERWTAEPHVVLVSAS